jgi:hypothetical protein
LSVPTHISTISLLRKTHTESWHVVLATVDRSSLWCSSISFDGLEYCCSSTPRIKKGEDFAASDTVDGSYVKVRTLRAAAIRTAGSELVGHGDWHFTLRIIVLV